MSNSYQKLKAENEKLKRQVYVLVKEPESNEAKQIKFLYNMDAMFEEIVWKSSILTSGTTFDGLVKQIKNG